MEVALYIIEYLIIAWITAKLYIVLLLKTNSKKRY